MRAPIIGRRARRHSCCEPMCEKTTRAAFGGRGARSGVRSARMRDARRRALDRRWIRERGACNLRWNREHGAWEARAFRVGTALDREESPLDLRHRNVRPARYTERAGPRNRISTKQSSIERTIMPELSFFYGIRITIDCEKNAPHHKPHFHASYGGFEAVYQRKGNCSQASFLPAKRNSLSHGRRCTSPSSTTTGTSRTQTEHVFALTR